MFFGGHDHALTGLPAAFFRPAVREGKPPVVAGEKHGDERRVPVHDGLLARTVPRADHSHTVVFRVDRVMLRVNVNGISRDWLWFRSCRHFASVSLWNGVPGNGASIPLGTKARNPNPSPKVGFPCSPERSPQKPVSRATLRVSDSVWFGGVNRAYFQCENLLHCKEEGADGKRQVRAFRATGTVGRALASKLAERGQTFRVVGRSEERLRRDFRAYEPLVEYCAADLSDPMATARAAAGVDTIFYTVGVPYPQFEQHPKRTRVALEAAAAAGVRHFVHLSTVYPYGVPQQDFVSESHPRNPTAFKGRMRKEQEDLVQTADNPKGMRTTILRPPDFYGPDSELSYVRAIFDAALRGGTANVIGPIDTPHEFIFVPDLAETLIAISEREEAYGKAWNVAGPGLITTRQFAEEVFATVHQKPRLRVAGKFMLRVLGLFNPFLREVVEMHYLWTTPVKLDDTCLRQLLPSLHKTPYPEGIRATMDAMRARAVPAAA